MDFGADRFELFVDSFDCCSNWDARFMLPVTASTIAISEAIVFKLNTTRQKAEKDRMVIV